MHPHPPAQKSQVIFQHPFHRTRRCFLADPVPKCRRNGPTVSDPQNTPIAERITLQSLARSEKSTRTTQRPVFSARRNIHRMNRVYESQKQAATSGAAHCPSSTRTRAPLYVVVVSSMKAGTRDVLITVQSSALCIVIVVFVAAHIRGNIRSCSSRHIECQIPG